MRSPLHLRQLFIPSLLILLHQSFFAIADPLSLPVAALDTDALILSRPNALTGRAAEALAEAKPDAIAQSNYYAFSGAIYIVGANGQTLPLNAASPAYCPNQAPQGCGNIGVWNWCCPSGNTCAWASSDHSIVGCCPSGQTCGGSVDRSQISTVTVYVTTTQYAGGVNNVQSTVVVGGGGALVGQTTRTVQYNGYCSTLVVQNGPNLPTTAPGTCGTILVVGEASRRGVGMDILMGLGVLYGSLGFIWGFFGRGRW